MNKTELITAIAERTGMDKKHAQEFFASYVEVTKEALGRGESIQLIGFLSLTVKETAARTGRNPKTKEAIEISAGKRIAVSMSKELKEIVNSKKENSKPNAVAKKKK